MVIPRRLRKELTRLEAALRPIATRPVDLSDPNWYANLSKMSPLDEAGVRAEVEALLRDILMEYAATTADGREAIRKWVARHSSFAWAATPPKGATARETVRLQLLHFSLCDQGGDPRDAVLWLDEICHAPGIPRRALMSIRAEVAQLSSDKDKYRWGSTKAMLLCGYGPYGSRGAPRIQSRVSQRRRTERRKVSRKRRARKSSRATALTKSKR